MLGELRMTAIDPQGLRLSNVGVLRGQRWLLRDVNWSLPAGACGAILGPNGSGKSTLARVITGYLWPTRGDVRVDGRHFGEVDLNELRRSIRLVQAAGPYDVDPSLTAGQVVLTGLFGTIGLFDATTSDDESRADDWLDRVGLSNLRDQPYSKMSSGERVRALIARALIGRPHVLLLDEPTAGLDLLAREQVLATVQAMFSDAASHDAPAPTVVMITHHTEELPPATSSVLLLDGGAVAASGPPGQVLRDDVLARVYRCPLSVTSHGGRYYTHVDASAWPAMLTDPEAKMGL
jgi:iron complex transport system ATP-binding protein